MRPIGSAQYGLLAFPPFCATSASASPRGRRERTLVRPLALGLASLNSPQTDENASLEGALLALPIRAFGALFRPLGSIRAFDALFRSAQYGLLAVLCAHARCAHTHGLGRPYWLCQYGRFMSAPKTAKDCQKAVDNISSRRSNDAFCALRSAFWANPTRHGATNK